MQNITRISMRTKSINTLCRSMIISMFASSLILSFKRIKKRIIKCKVLWLKVLRSSSKLTKKRSITSREVLTKWIKCSQLVFQIQERLLCRSCKITQDGRKLMNILKMRRSSETMMITNFVLEYLSIPFFNLL